MDLNLICPPYLHWVRDQQQVILVDTRSGAAHSLRGLAAAIWQWLPWDYSYEALLDFTTDLLQIERAQAGVELSALLLDWLARGWLLDESECSNG